MTNEAAITEASVLEADACRWAIHALDFDKQSELLDHAALLRLVVRRDYSIGPEMIDAVQIVSNSLSLTAQPGRWRQAASQGRHQRCLENVTAFVQQFFDLSCDERRRRWTTLVMDCAGEPASAMWLNRLERGLDAELPPLTDNSNDNHLIQTCREVFLARPAKAARLRREFCEMWRRDVSTWENVTDEALERHPQFLEAVAPWVDEFGELRWRESVEESEQQELRRRWVEPYSEISRSQCDTIDSTDSSKFVDQVTGWGLRLAFVLIVGILLGNFVALIRAIVADLSRW